jgi:hypothetical protein
MKLHPANTGAGGGTPVGRKRYAMALLCLWITTICYADRTLSVA